MWIIMTLFAVLMQSFRNAGQKKLVNNATHVLVATWVRFLFGVPLAIIFAAFLLADTSIITKISASYLSYILVAAISQLIAALLGVMLLQRRNFAVGTTLVKTETLFIAILSLIFLDDFLTILDWIAVLVGIIGILLITTNHLNLSFNTLLEKLDTPSAILGLLSGLFFAVTAIYVRKSNLELQNLSFYQQGILTLTIVLLLQSILGGIYILLKDRSIFVDILSNLKMCLFIGTVSMLGSFGWFTAYAMQNATYVKILGHTEIIIAIIFTWKYFKETISFIEYVAIAMIIISAIIVIT